MPCRVLASSIRLRVMGGAWSRRRRAHRLRHRRFHAARQARSGHEACLIFDRASSWLSDMIDTYHPTVCALEDSTGRTLRARRLASI